jgi:hypothetical protein
MKAARNLYRIHPSPLGENRSNRLTRTTHGDSIERHPGRTIPPH